MNPISPFFLDGSRSFNWINLNANALDSVGCDSNRGESFFYLVPPATAVEAWWLFDEKLGWLSVAGMIVAVIGVVVVVKRL